MSRDHYTGGGERPSPGASTRTSRFLRLALLLLPAAWLFVSTLQVLQNPSSRLHAAVEGMTGWSWSRSTGDRTLRLDRYWLAERDPRSGAVRISPLDRSELPAPDELDASHSEPMVLATTLRINEGAAPSWWATTSNTYSAILIIERAYSHVPLSIEVWAAARDATVAAARGVAWADPDRWTDTELESVTPTEGSRGLALTAKWRRPSLSGFVHNAATFTAVSLLFAMGGRAIRTRTSANTRKIDATATTSSATPSRPAIHRASTSASSEDRNASQS